MFWGLISDMPAGTSAADNSGSAPQGTLESSICSGSEMAQIPNSIKGDSPSWGKETLPSRWGIGSLPPKSIYSIAKKEQMWPFEVVVICLRVYFWSPKTDQSLSPPSLFFILFYIFWSVTFRRTGYSAPIQTCNNWVIWHYQMLKAVLLKIKNKKNKNSSRLEAIISVFFQSSCPCFCFEFQFLWLEFF